MIEILLQRGAKNLYYNDPHVPSVRVDDKQFQSQKLTARLIQSADVVLITTNHSDYDYDFIVKNAKFVVDTRNATKTVKDKDKKVIRLGSGKQF